MKATILNTICGFEDSEVEVLEIDHKNNRVKVKCPRRCIYVLGKEDIKIDYEK